MLNEGKKEENQEQEEEIIYDHGYNGVVDTFPLAARALTWVKLVVAGFSL
jgi:hypothetical protein